MFSSTVRFVGKIGVVFCLAGCVSNNSNQIKAPEYKPQPQIDTPEQGEYIFIDNRKKRTTNNNSASPIGIPKTAPVPKSN